MWGTLVVSDSWSLGPSAGILKYKFRTSLTMTVYDCRSCSGTQTSPWLISALTLKVSISSFSHELKRCLFPSSCEMKVNELGNFFIEMVGDKVWQLICLYSDWLLAKFILVPWKKPPEYTCGQFEVFEHYILILKSTLALCEFVRYWFFIHQLSL